MSQRQSNSNMKSFFQPERVAVIGASRTPGKGGYNIIENLQRLGFPGAIYPVNPSADTILGLTAYPDITSTPETPDLALIVIPPSQVVSALRECIDRGVKSVIIETAGFGEAGEAGKREEQVIARLARESGTRVMGPNSVGTIDTYTPFDASLGRLNEVFLPHGELRKGSAGFIGQTGLFTGVFLPLLNEEIGVSKIACLGNKSDVDESDMLEHFGRDEHTSFIGMYLESIKDGRRFLKIAREVLPEKPIVVLKSAVTERGARMSASHTGSIAGEDHVYEAAFRQTGIIRVASFEELWSRARAFVHSPLPKGNRVAIINLAGSGCVTAVDACIRRGLKIADLSPATLKKCREVYPDWWPVGSPIDLWTAIEASGFEKAYGTVTRAALEDGGVDAAVVIGGAVQWMPGLDLPGLFADIARDFPEKPFFAVNPLGDREVFLQLHRSLLRAGIPSYSDDADAIASLAALWRYGMARERNQKL